MECKSQTGSVLVVAVLLILAVLVAGAIIQQRQKSQPTTTTPTIFTGFSYSPKTTSLGDIGGFYDVAKQNGNTVTWAGDWHQLASGNSGPYGMAGGAKKAGLSLIPIATTHTDSGGGKVKALRLLNEENLGDYRNGGARYAEKHKPAYFGLGIEINRVWESSPTEFAQLAELFNQTYDRIKAVSPNTKVFTVFQLERMKGLQGGLFGGQNDPALAQWQLLDNFSKADAFAFTTYPGLIYKTPAEIPADYYTELSSRTTKPILFTEIGWSSDMAVAGWQSDPTEQSEFVSRFTQLASTLNPAVSIWSFLYDQKLPVPFTGMGLIALDGTAKPGLEAWSTYATSR